MNNHYCCGKAASMNTYYCCGKTVMKFTLEVFNEKIITKSYCQDHFDKLISYIKMSKHNYNIKEITKLQFDSYKIFG